MTLDILRKIGLNSGMAGWIWRVKYWLFMAFGTGGREGTN
jgi:hypothetical protein